MFSTTTMASSTRMPIEKISANRLTRLSVKPQAQLANSVAVKVRITAGADDDRLAPAEREADQQDHRTGRERQLLDQLVGLLGGGFAIVARDAHLHAGGHQRVAQFVEPIACRARHVDRVGAGFLGDGERHRRVDAAGRCGAGRTFCRRRRARREPDETLRAARRRTRSSPPRSGRPACRCGCRPPVGRRPRPSAGIRRSRWPASAAAPTAR